MGKKYYRFFRLSLFKAVNEPLRPHAIAMGFSLGTFIGLGPTFGFQLIPAFLIANYFRYSRLAAVLCVFITNPLTVLPIYAFEYWLGARILDLPAKGSPEALEAQIERQGIMTIFDASWEKIAAFVVGSFLAAVVGAVISYFLGRVLVSTYRVARQKAKPTEIISMVKGVKTKAGKLRKRPKTRGSSVATTKKAPRSPLRRLRKLPKRSKKDSSNPDAFQT